MISTTIIVILLIVCFALAYATMNLLSKLEYTEDILESVYVDLTKVFSIISNIDEKGSFEADDEVGDTYKLIRGTIKFLSIYLEPMPEGEE